MLIALLAIPDKATDLLYAPGLHYLARSAWRGLRLGLVFSLTFYLIERFYKVPSTKYKSRNFLHDVCYWIYNRSDLPRILFTGWLFTFLGTHCTIVKITAIESLPIPVRWVIYLVTAEFTIYWIHRWQHSNAFLWTLHSVHHSQRELNFATVERVHPLDNFLANTLAFLPHLVLGQNVQTWLPVYYLVEFLIALEHTEIPWRFGPLYRVVVSPTFHSIHHSMSPEHHNRNFGRLLSIWDYIFGTASDDRTRPKAYGLQDLEMPTVKSQLWFPLVRLYRDFLRPDRGTQPVQEATRADIV